MSRQGLFVVKQITIHPYPPPKVNVIRHVGSLPRYTITEDSFQCTCPDCGVDFYFSEEDVKGIFGMVAKWHAAGLNMDGLFDCPNAACERPFNIWHHVGKTFGVGCPQFYQYEKPGITKKAAREPRPSRVDFPVPPS